MGQIRQTAAARKDADAIYDYIATECDNPDAADKLLSDIAETIRTVASSPLIGESVNSLRAETRRIAVRKNYLVFYQPLGSGILILRILHAKRDIANSAFKMNG